MRVCVCNVYGIAPPGEGYIKWFTAATLDDRHRCRFETFYLLLTGKQRVKPVGMRAKDQYGVQFKLIENQEITTIRVAVIGLVVC